MSSPILFTPMQIGNLKLSNRIVIAPMAQYSSENGQMNDWHLMHLGQLANSGAAALTIEGAAVSPDGRTSYADVGLYSDETEASIARVLHGVRRWSDIPIGIQLNHAGRKGSRQKLWDGVRRFLRASQMGGRLTLRHRSLSPLRIHHPSR